MTPTTAQKRAIADLKLDGCDVLSTQPLMFQKRDGSEVATERLIVEWRDHEGRIMQAIVEADGRLMHERQIWC